MTGWPEPSTTSAQLVPFHQNSGTLGVKCWKIQRRSPGVPCCEATWISNICARRRHAGRRNVRELGHGHRTVESAGGCLFRVSLIRARRRNRDRPAVASHLRTLRAGKVVFYRSDVQDTINQTKRVNSGVQSAELHRDGIGSHGAVPSFAGVDRTGLPLTSEFPRFSPAAKPVIVYVMLVLLRPAPWFRRPP